MTIIKSQIESFDLHIAKELDRDNGLLISIVENNEFTSDVWIGKDDIQLIIDSLSEILRK